MAGTKEEWDELQVKSGKDSSAMKFVQEGWADINDQIVEDKNGEFVGVIVPQEDVVNDPSHYNDVPAEFEHHRVMDAIGANYHFANSMKYLWRAGKKTSKGMSIADKEIQDVRKAIRYLQMWIDLRQEVVTKEDFHAVE